MLTGRQVEKQNVTVSHHRNRGYLLIPTRGNAQMKATQHKARVKAQLKPSSCHVVKASGWRFSAFVLESISCRVRFFFLRTTVTRKSQEKEKEIPFFALQGHHIQTNKFMQQADERKILFRARCPRTRGTGY